MNLSVAAKVILFSCPTKKHTRFCQFLGAYSHLKFWIIKIRQRSAQKFFPSFNVIYDINSQKFTTFAGKIKFFILYL
jgi:hypothetical protein